MPADFYGTVIREGSRWRMWYYACHMGRNPDWSPAHARQIAKNPPWMKSDTELYGGPLCVAESTGGIVRQKPALGQVSFHGSVRNNALALPHTVVSGATALRDDEDPDPARRYKLVYQYFPDQTDPLIPEYGSMPTIATAVSADGLTWTGFRIPYRDEFVEHSSFYRHGGLFIVNYQTAGHLSLCSEGGAPCGRTGVVKLSPDFDHWVPGLAVSFGLPEGPDPAKRGMEGAYDQVHLGVGAASLGNVCVGLHGRWHSPPGDDFRRISCDLGLVVSNDGIAFREPAKDVLFIRGAESPVTQPPGRTYNTNLCQGNGILTVGDETRIYHGRWRNVGTRELSDDYAEIALATIPRDRWGALRLNPDTRECMVWSAPVRLPVRWTASLNATGGAGIAVDIADARFRLVPEFSGANAGRIEEAGDVFDGPVRWTAGDLARLAGPDIRLCILMDRTAEVDPAPHAVYLSAVEDTP